MEYFLRVLQATKVNVTPNLNPNTKPAGRLLAATAAARAAHHDLDLPVQHQHERAADRAQRVRPGALEHGLHPSRQLRERKHSQGSLCRP